jgi:RNA polymerase sigma factor (sigma-70 family)
MDQTDSLQRLPGNLERCLADARPRLLRLAQSQGISPPEAEDLVQETLLEAWRHVDALRAPERFDAWLDGICRNRCLHFWRHQRVEHQHLLPRPSTALTYQNDTEEFLVNLPDLHMLENDEILEHQERQRLLERACGHLPLTTRQVIQVCYLAEVPQKEAAAQLGLTLSALEARVQRARQQLRRVLLGPLRSEAESLELLIDSAMPAGWRESSLWCFYCGQQRLHGFFTTLTEGGSELHMRCPSCSKGGHFGINGPVGPGGQRTFRPAIKRLWQRASQFFSSALAQGGQHLCLGCQRPLLIHIRPPLHPSSLQAGEHFVLNYDCPACGPSDSSALLACICHPAIQRFLAEHPRVVLEPDREESFEGSRAMQFRLAEVTSARRLTVFADRHSAQVLAVFTE